MRVIISAGGTGGHIYPALAIINKIKQMNPQSEFLYIGTHNRMEKDIVPKQGIPFETIEMYGLNRKNMFKNFKTIKCFIKGYYKCRKIIKNFKPDIVIGVGGYITVPVICAAKKLGYNTFLHEQNSIPGKANQFLSSYATKIGVSFKSSIKYFPEYKTVFTGNPCSENALNSKPINKKNLRLDEHKKLVVFVMGSLGASKVNDYIVKIMPNFADKDYEVLFITGNSDYDKIKQNKFPNNVKVLPYMDNLQGLLKVTDLIVTRAGATTLSEVMALEVPSIIIPSPYVPNNHQYKNAMDLVNNDAAELILENELEGNILIDKVDSLLNDCERLKKMKRNLSKMSVKDSASQIYKAIKKIVGSK